ncbi:hypothetical protein [Rubritalea sp.]|uniref:hypothetical protein n=1 Tax=Rubritalea sp. TaxID=2109375 RepID=UPI003EF9E7BF
MKNKILPTIVVAICAGSAQADLLVTAPGLASARFIASSSTSNSITLNVAPASDPSGTYSEYRITGIEYVLKGGIPVGGSSKNSGAILDSEGKSVSSTNKVDVVISTDGSQKYSGEASLNVSSYKDSASGNFSFGSDIVANDEPVTITVTQSFSNDQVLAGDYSYIVIEGSYVEDGTSPEGYINRKSSTMSQVLTSSDNASIEFGVSLASLDSGDEGEAGGNNGFGNNEDFIDGGNVNAMANASKWARSGKINITTSGEDMASLMDDDEK